jgi:hypothetical protein
VRRTPLTAFALLSALAAPAPAPARARASAAGAWSAAEDPLRDVPVHASGVSAAPSGPPTPASGWSLVYADAFGAPFGIGPGEDNTLFQNSCSATTNCPAFNSNELEVMSTSAVTQTADGLRLTCTHSERAQQPGSKHYVCGTVSGRPEAIGGDSFFSWSPGHGQTLVFEAVAKLPQNTGEADPGWWSDGPPWNGAELDFFEGGGWSFEHTSGWRTDELFTAWFAPPGLSASKRGFATDPSLAFHTYTFELAPDDTYSVWIDGAPQPWAAKVGPAHPVSSAKDTLILSYALRTCATCHSAFDEGRREFDVRSIAVYEDRAHAGVGVANAGLAPGTVIE